MPTIKDVAQRAGVSITTVSHVLNGTRYVSEELRERVHEAMKALDYHPNILARSLRQGISHTIGLIVPDNSNPFFAEIARVAETLGFESGYSVILCNSDKKPDREAAYVGALIAKQVDGVLFIASSSTHANLLALKKRDIPVVVVDRDIGQTLADVVLVNNEQGAYDATHYLIGLGHRRIACIATPLIPSASAMRVQGYKRALSEAGIPVREEFIVRQADSYLGGELAMTQLLQLDELPSAVFIYNDVMAIGALRAIRNAGLKVPDDLSIIGFDDIPLASAMWPPLTTVAQPISEMTTLAMQLLMSRMQKNASTPRQKIVLDAKLVVRESCAPPRA